jgi:hypothetical protein
MASLNPTSAGDLILDRGTFLDRKMIEMQQRQQEIEKRRMAIGEDRMIYCEWLQINAMEIRVSFLSTPWREKVQDIDAGTLEVMVHYLGSFSNLDSAPIKLNALILQRPFCPRVSLQNTIVQHYIRQALSEWYKVEFILLFFNIFYYIYIFFFSFLFFSFFCFRSYLY